MYTTCSCKYVRSFNGHSNTSDKPNSVNLFDVGNYRCKFLWPPSLARQIYRKRFGIDNYVIKHKLIKHDIRKRSLVRTLR